MFVNLTNNNHINDLVVALLSNDDDLAYIVRSAVEMPWRLEHHFYSAGVSAFLHLAAVRLVVVDDESVGEGDRGWLLRQIRRNLDEATLLYVAGSHSAENERRARGNGAHYYTAKPVQSAELKGVLRGFMNRANR
jgi:DNA-binding response OmpR family regulator